MRRYDRVVALLVGAVGAAFLGNACGPRPATPSTSSDASRRSISLPDLSKMAPSVQTQIQTRYTALLETIASQSTAALDLANAYGEMGKLFMAAQFPDASETCFLNAQGVNPSDFRWPYYLGHVYRTQGDLPKAVAMFERALQLQPDDVDALVWLGDLNLSLGRPEAAEPLFARALERQSSSMSARFGLGRAALARNDYRRAVTHLEEILAQDPKAAAAHYPLSQAYAALGETKKAGEHLRQRREHEILPADPLVVELDSLLHSPQTYETLGIRALDRQDWPAAATEFRKGLDLAPDSAALHHRLGTALSMMGDAGGAQAQFEEAVRLSPDYFLAQYSLGVIRQAEGRHAEAIERFTFALRSRPTYTEARVRLAASLRRTGRAKESLAHYDEALAQNADLVEARIGTAVALTQLRRDAEARDHLFAAMKADPAQPAFAHGLARLLATSPDEGVRDGPRAMALVQELLLQGRTLDLGETLAMSLAELGQHQQAASVQRDLLAAAQKSGLVHIVPRLAANLKLYEAGQPCRTPWTADELP